MSSEIEGSKPIFVAVAVIVRAASQSPVDSNRVFVLKSMEDFSGEVLGNGNSFRG